MQPGPANSYWSLRSTWANLSNTPYRQFKQTGFEGGSLTPFIAFWQGVIEPNTITSQTGHVVDIAPTFLEILGIEYPNEIEGYKTLELHGSSILPIFKGEERKTPDFFVSGLDKFRMYRKGEYKIVRMNGGEWELYNMIDDPTEINDLATEMPSKVNEIVKEYEELLFLQ